MNDRILVVPILVGCLVTTCQASAEDRNFGRDVTFLKKHVKTIVLGESSDGPRVAVVPAYQGRVMTTTAQGGKGASSGWINYELIEQGVVSAEEADRIEREHPANHVVRMKDVGHLIHDQLPDAWLDVVFPNGKERRAVATLQRRVLRACPAAARLVTRRGGVLVDVQPAIVRDENNQCVVVDLVAFECFDDSPHLLVQI